MSERSRRPALVELTLARIRESLREPGVMFWVFGFPILLSVGLGLAFRGRPPQPAVVGVLDGPGAPAALGTLAAAGMRAERLHDADARERLRTGRVAVVVVAGATPGAPIVYRFDPMRDEAREA